MGTVNNRVMDCCFGRHRVVKDPEELTYRWTASSEVKDVGLPEGALGMAQSEGAMFCGLLSHQLRTKGVTAKEWNDINSRLYARVYRGLYREQSERNAALIDEIMNINKEMLSPKGLIG